MLDHYTVESTGGHLVLWCERGGHRAGDLDACRVNAWNAEGYVSLDELQAAARTHEQEHHT